MAQNDAETAALLQWWHQQQSQVCRTEADVIRNGLMQDVFAMRRRLEMACHWASEEADACKCQVHLAELERLYVSLENISDRLDNPFTQDSLPLALRYRLDSWGRSLPITLNFPHVWKREPMVHTQLLLVLIGSLCQRLSNIQPLPQACCVALNQSENIKSLTFRATYSHRLPPPLWDEIVAVLTPAINTFQILMSGNYSQTLHSQAASETATWILHWPDPLLDD